MAWKTIYNVEIEYPWKAAGSPPGTWSPDTHAWVSRYQRLFDQAQRMEAEICGLRDENLRLKHENEFMLRLVNSRMTAGDEDANNAADGGVGAPAAEAAPSAIATKQGAVCASEGAARTSDCRPADGQVLSHGWAYKGAAPTAKAAQ